MAPPPRPPQLTVASEAPEPLSVSGAMASLTEHLEGLTEHLEGLTEHLEGLTEHLEPPGAAPQKPPPPDPAGLQQSQPPEAPGRSAGEYSIQ